MYSAKLLNFIMIFIGDRKFRFKLRIQIKVDKHIPLKKVSKKILILCKYLLPKY